MLKVKQISNDINLRIEGDYTVTYNNGMKALFK